MTQSLLSIQGVTKKYPLVVANDCVSLEVREGEIHAVLGENGAGKSTLMKIIYGSVKPDEGEIYFKGELVNIKNPQEARRLGISMVFQHFNLIFWQINSITFLNHLTILNQYKKPILQ